MFLNYINALTCKALHLSINFPSTYSKFTSRSIWGVIDREAVILTQLICACSELSTIYCGQKYPRGTPFPFYSQVLLVKTVIWRGKLSITTRLHILYIFRKVSMLTAENIGVRINAFIASLKVNRNLSQKSLAAYRCDLRGLERWASGHVVGEIVRENLMRFFSTLTEGSLKPSSIRRKLVTIGAFIDYCRHST